MHRVEEDEEQEEINKGIVVTQVIKSSECIINLSLAKISLHQIHVFDKVYEGTGQILLKVVRFMLIFTRIMASKVKLGNQRLI